MSSFAGTTIYVLADGIPRKSAADVTIRHMPGGNTSYIDIGGRQLQELDLSLYFAAALDAVAFEGLEGTVGTLEVPDGTYTALLMTLQRTTRGLSSTGDTVLTATFMLL